MANIALMLSEQYNVEFSKESSDIFNSSLTRKEYAIGDLFLSQNKIYTDIYIVEKGMIRQFYYKEGRDVSEHFSIEGGVVFCIESLFLKEPANLLIEALEPTIIYHLNYDLFQELCDTYKDINKLYRKIMELDLIISQRKADAWRFESSTERYKRFCIEYPEVVKRASVSQIASYLFMTPETLSRIRSGTL